MRYEENERDSQRDLLIGNARDTGGVGRGQQGGSKLNKEGRGRVDRGSPRGIPE